MMNQPECSQSDVLAEKRTELAGERTDLACERTLMGASRTLLAWVRTGLSMIAFGFTIYEILKGMLREGIQLTPRLHGPRNIGLFLIALGTLSTLVGSLEYWQIAGDLHKKFGTPFRKFPVIVSGLIFMLGLWLFVSILIQADFL